MNPWISGWAMVYLAVTLGLGVWAARRTRDARDFFIAGQRLGLWVTALATMSAAFSGFAFVGGPGLTYRMGLAALMICLPVGFTTALLCVSAGERLRRLAGRGDVFTVPDALFARWGSRAVSGLAAGAVLVGSVGYLGTQMLALGVTLEAVFGGPAALGGWSGLLALALGVAVVMFYATAGGMVAAVYTDVVQGALMALCGVAVFWVALDASGGWRVMIETLLASPEHGARFLDPLGGRPAWVAFGFFFVFGVGTLGQPQLLHKFFMIRDPRQLRFLPLLVAGGQTLCVLLWLGIGLAVPALVVQGRLAPLVRPDDATPTFLLQIAPPALAGLVFAGILAAIMSTADSFLSIAAAAFVRDLPRAFGRPLANELRAGRWATAVTLLAATALAATYKDLIALLGTFSFGTLAAALAPVIGIGLAWRRVSARAAACSITTGALLNLGLELASREVLGLPRLPLPAGVSASAVALAASFVVLFLASWWWPAVGTPRPRVEPLPEGRGEDEGTIRFERGR